MYQTLKDFNVLIGRKNLFDLLVKNEEETYFSTGNLLDFGYLKKNYRLIAIGLSKQTKLKYPQQISFIGKLDEANGVTMFFIIKKSEETSFIFSQNSVTII